MIDLFLIAFATIALAYTTYTDMRSKVVPDNIVYGMIGLGVVLRIIQAIIYGLPSLQPIVVGLVIYSLLGVIFYRFRGWADGDLGMFLVVALFLPTNTLAPWPTFVSFLVNMSIIGTIYGLGYTLFLAFRPDIFKDWTGKMSSPVILGSAVLALVCGGATQISGLTFIPGFFVGAILIPLSLVVNNLEKFMQRWVTASELETGDWVLQDVVVGKKVIISKGNPGLTQEQIGLLKNLSKSRKVKKILIKDGIPFVPVFLFSYLASSFYGDIIYKFVSFMLSKSVF